MTAQSAHDWALHRWRTLHDQARAATPGPWSEDDLVGFEYLAALGPDRVIVLCGQAIDRLTAHAPNPGSWCDGCRDDDGYGYNPVDWPCPEVRAWTAWWAGQDDYPAELK